MRQPLFCGIPTSGPSVNGIPTSGPPATAVRSSSCPVPPVGQHLTGWKGFGAAPTCDIFDVAATCGWGFPKGIPTHALCEKQKYLP